VNRVEMRYRPAGGSFTAMQFAGPALVDAVDPQVGIDSSGNAVVVWRKNDGTNYRASALGRSTGGTLSAVQTLSASGEDAIAPQVADDPSGDAVVVWHRSDGTNDRAQIRARSASGVLSATQNLSLAGFNASNPQVGIDTSGKAVATWLRSGAQIEARTRSATGTLGPTAILRQSVQFTDFPQIGVSATGAATAAWGEELGSGGAIEVAEGP